MHLGHNKKKLFCRERGSYGKISVSYSRCQISNPGGYLITPSASCMYKRKPECLKTTTTTTTTTNTKQNKQNQKQKQKQKQTNKQKTKNLSDAFMESSNQSHVQLPVATCQLYLSTFNHVATGTAWVMTRNMKSRAVWVMNPNIESIKLYFLFGLLIPYWEKFSGVMWILTFSLLTS